MTSKDYLKQIAESKGVCPLTNEVKDNALLFPIGFEYIFQDLDRLEKCLKVLKIMWNKNVNIVYIKIFKYFEKYSEYYTGYSSKDKLTKEEFDLLKEVLENDF